MLDILVISLRAVLAGADSQNAIKDFEWTRRDWLKERLELPNASPP